MTDTLQSQMNSRKTLSIPEQQRKMMSSVLFWMRVPVTISTLLRFRAYLKHGGDGDLAIFLFTAFNCVLVYTLYYIHKRGVSTTIVGRTMLGCFMVAANIGLTLSDTHSGPFVPLVAQIMLINLMCLFAALFEKPNRIPVWGGILCTQFIIFAVVRWFLKQPNVEPFVWFAMTLTPCMAFIAVSFVLRTITGRYSELYQDSEHARGALLDSLTQVEEARDEALRANQTKSTFLANMSHELRTPLNAIMGYAELLGEEFEEDDDPRFGDTEKIRSAGTHLLELIDELLDLSKLESGRLELALDHHSLEDELLYLSSMTVPLAAKNNNKWEYHMSPILLGKRFTFDALRLRQCLINLIGNAAKFTYDGSIKLDVQLQEDGPQPMIQLAVIDTGIGMTKEQCENVFNPFWQADASSTRKVGGVGLGMALTHRLIERMGGFVTVESEPGVGTTFTIFLPAAIEHSIISADDSLMTDDSLVYGIEATA